MRHAIRPAVVVGTVICVSLALMAKPIRGLKVTMGPQKNGNFVVSTGQTVLAGSFAFDQRLSDIALSPDGRTLAVVGKSKLFWVLNGKVVESGVDIGANAGFHGVVWLKDGKSLVVSTESGHLQRFEFEPKTQRFKASSKIDLSRPGFQKNPVPGGMDVTADGKRLFAACVNLNAIVEVDLATNKRIAEYPTENLPFTVRLAQNDSKLVVTNWGGQLPEKDDLTDKSEDLDVKVTKEGNAATGTVSIIDLATKVAKNLSVGLHPTGVAIQGDQAFVANSLSDSVSEINLNTAKVTKTTELKLNGRRIIGSMPNEIAVLGDRLYLCNGGDNALCEVDRDSGKVLGYRPAGYFPTGVQLSADGKTAFVVNTKGNGSVRNSVKNAVKRNTHDFQGTVSVIDLTKNLDKETESVAFLNSWNQPLAAYKPDLKVYQGAIKHVIYVIKENRTYDEIYGDMPIGDGDPELASLGHTVMPNHQKIAKEFGLFDNAYTCGTNSADGHQWCDQAMANEYLEHFYVGYSRTYPDDGEDAMALNPTGRIWDAARKAGKRVRVYGEWAGDEQAKYEPRAPKDWFEAWEDRQSGKNIFKYKAHTRVRSLQPILCPDYHYWPLVQSDQSRIDVFEREFKQFVKSGTLPNLMVMSLPSDHSEGLSEKYPTPRSMMADNDLALGRLVELVSHSMAWKNTCIFVTQDDSQGGPDHVDGHRSVCLVVSPYSKRGVVNSGFTTQLNTLRTIETMLNIKPMTKFDTIARPMTECFTNNPDFTPFSLTPNIVPLGERNPSKEKQTAMDKEWFDRSASLDWSGIDRADFYWLNRIVWYSIHHGAREYPGRPTDEPGQVDRD